MSSVVINILAGKKGEGKDFWGKIAAFKYQLSLHRNIWPEIFLNHHPASKIYLYFYFPLMKNMSTIEIPRVLHNFNLFLFKFAAFYS